jgi:centromere protein C
VIFDPPIGNTYFIENICERDAKLFFTQARKVAMSKEELAVRAEVAAELQRRKSVVRSSSAGAQSKLSTPNESAA